MTFCALASGSAGNAALVSTASTRILVDAGLSLRELQRRLALIGEDLERVDALCVSHSHRDHAGALPTMMANRKVRAKFYMTPLTRAELAKNQFGFDDDGNIEEFYAGDDFRIGDIAVHSFALSHDAVDTVGFTFTAGGARIGMAVDLGCVTETVIEPLRGVDLLMIESNHDRDICLTGPYPISVKRRVLASTGHLCNDDLAEYLVDHLQKSTRQIVLGHLSQTNNHPRLAYLVASEAAKRAGRDPAVSIAEQGKPTEVFEV